jgi:hypothetical protein
MASIFGDIAVTCPACGAEIIVPVRAADERLVNDTLIALLQIDVEPIQTHAATHNGPHGGGEPPAKAA